ncbi:MAG: hypothetical protein HY554_08555 [Elusimicrobia bacterium]|nr:hypothetical protein [Elusimicrobiota bacterium]
MNRRAALERAEKAGAGAALALALGVNLHAGRLASRLGEGSASVRDSLLDVLPVLDTRPLFTWGFGAFVAALAAACLWRERQRLAWIAWSYAVLIAARSACILLTPLRAPEGALWVAGDPAYEAIGRYLTFPHDLFFSSHTAMPFLGFLLLTGRGARAACLAASVALGAAVLLARLHYSIDVAAAYAFTYAIHQANRRLARRPFLAWRRRFLANSTA